VYVAGRPHSWKYEAPRRDRVERTTVRVFTGENDGASVLFCSQALVRTVKLLDVVDSGPFVIPPVDGL